MSEYENRIFDTLTASEEKFKTASEIAKHFNGTKKKLITQFWKNVEKELKLLIAENEEDFGVVLDSDIFHKNSKCFLYIENNRKARILYEHLADNQSMGLWIDNQNFDMAKINNYIATHGHEITDVINHAWWVSYKNINENFNSFDSLVMILPNNSREYSKRKAQDLYEFAVANKEHLKYVINNCLK
jgi:hypothetical protein